MVPEMLNRGGNVAAAVAVGGMDSVSGAARRKLLMGSSAEPTSNKTPTNCSEIFSGRLSLPDAGGLRVAVKVHRTTADHFALVFPDKLHVCKPIGFVNLKNCRVELSSSSSSSASSGCVSELEQRTLHVVQRSCDGDKLTLRADTVLDAKKCAEAMRSKHTTDSSSSSLLSSCSSSVSRFRDDCCVANATQLPNILEEGDEE